MMGVEGGEGLGGTRSEKKRISIGIPRHGCPDSLWQRENTCPERLVGEGNSDREEGQQGRVCGWGKFFCHESLCGTMIYSLGEFV